MSGKVLQKFYNVAILGATGPVGTGLVEAFTSNARFKTNVRFLYRKESAQV
jgi:aspartate-semialdehyde dehydrogenase